MKKVAHKQQKIKKSASLKYQKPTLKRLGNLRQITFLS